MTQRYLHPNNNNTQWFVRANTIIGNSNENITIAPDNSNNVGFVIDCASYLQIPTGVSNERPNISNSYSGMIRYNTTENIIEFFNGSSSIWSAISAPSPVITSVSPNYINFGISGGIINYPDSSFSLIGTDFDTVGGVDVIVRGNNNLGTIVNTTTEIVNSSTNVIITFDASGTEQLVGISNELPFAITLTNASSGFSSTKLYAIIATNQGPIFTEPSTFSPSIFQDFAVQDGSASFNIAATDLSSPAQYPLKNWQFVSGTAGGFNNAGINDISINDASSATVKLPPGALMDAAADGTQYSFILKVEDASGATSNANYKLRLKHPTLTSISPNVVEIGTTNITIVGTFYIANTDVSFVDGATILTKSSVTYNSSTSLTVNNLNCSTRGTYDVNLTNGSVVVNIPTQLIVYEWSSTEIISYIAANCGDQGVYQPGTVPYDFGTPTYVGRCYGWSSFAADQRSANITIQSSDDNSTWTTRFTGAHDNNQVYGLSGTNCGIMYDNAQAGPRSPATVLGYGAHRYWRFVEGSAIVGGHYPRTAYLAFETLLYG